MIGAYYKASAALEVWPADKCVRLLAKFDKFLFDRLSAMIQGIQCVKKP